MIVPYLHFQGNCEEALHYYADIFDGKILSLSRYTEAAMPMMPGCEGLLGKVMHAHLSLGEVGALSGADQPEPVGSTSIDLLIHCPTEAVARRYFDAIAKDGTVLGDLTAHPPPDDDGVGGVVRDRYGYVWIFAAPRER